jgi:hypothetical protein
VTHIGAIAQEMLTPTTTTTNFKKALEHLKEIAEDSNHQGSTMAFHVLQELATSKPDDDSTVGMRRMVVAVLKDIAKNTKGRKLIGVYKNNRFLNFVKHRFSKYKSNYNTIR